MKKEVVIDGNSFSTLMEFYDEIERKFTKNLDYKIGRNLDAFNDVLYGGFGVCECEEPFKLIWQNSEKSRQDLGYDQTIAHLEGVLRSCHSSNIPAVKERLEAVRSGKGQTLYDIIIEIIRDHEHVELILE